MAEPSESRSYREFVTRSLNEVQRGLKLDSFHPGSKKRKVHSTFEAQQRKKPNRSAAERVIDGRFALGGDDATYLASGLAVLWSTVGDARDPNEPELGLAPASLYAPDAVNGIRKGLIAALERRNEELRKEAPRSLPRLLRALQVLMEQIDTVPSDLKALLKRGTVRTVEERTALLTFLMRMRRMLHPEAKDNLAGLILAKGRMQITEVVNRFSQEKAALIAEHERRFAEAQRLSGVRCTRRVGVEVQRNRNLWNRNGELYGLLQACEERLRANGASPGDSSTDGATTQDDPNAVAQATALADAIAQQLRQQQAIRDAEIAANPEAEAALQGIAQPQNPQNPQQAAQDAEIAANPEAADALKGVLGGEGPNAPAPPAPAPAPAPAPPAPASRWASLREGLGAAVQGAQAMAAAAGPARTHTPGTTPPPTPPSSEPPSPSAWRQGPLPPQRTLGWQQPPPPPEDDFVTVALKSETNFVAWQQQARATRNEFTLRIDTLAQQLKDMQAAVDADSRSMSKNFEDALNTRDDKLNALQKLVTGRSALLSKLRAQLSDSKKAHEALKAKHAKRLDGLKQGVADLEEAQRTFTENVPKLFADLRAQIDARTADAEAIKKALRGMGSDVQAKASKAAELQQSNQELRELKARMGALELAQVNAKAGIIQETKAALTAELVTLRAEEEARATAAETANAIVRARELERVAAELEAVQGAVKKLEAGAASVDVVETLRKDFGRLSGDFAPRQQAIDLNTTAMVRVKAEMERLQAALQALEQREKSRHAEVATAVAAAKGQATAVDDKVVALAEEVAKLKGDGADDAQKVAGLQAELALLRLEVAERDQGLREQANEQAALRASRASSYDERFGAINQVLERLSKQVQELADNQGALQTDMVYDEQYLGADFVTHMLNYEDKDDTSVIKQDLRELYQSFRATMEQPGNAAKREGMEASFDVYEEALKKVQSAWQHKDQSGEPVRKAAKAKLIYELDAMKTYQLRVLSAWLDTTAAVQAYTNATASEYKTDMERWIEESFASQKQRLETLFPNDDYDGGGGTSYEPLGVFSATPDAWTVPYAIARGLVGQRGPTEPACAARCPTDALLPYAAPDVDAFVRHALPVKRMLEHSPDPSEEDVAEALKACAPYTDSSADVGEALALLQDDYAITGITPASELGDERCGVEVPHEVRWLPQGPRASTMCRVAMLEHAAARCTQVANQADVVPEVARTLRDAAVSLKLQQLKPLYALNEAAEFADEPHPLGTEARLVTRPCAVVRGTLSFPTDVGIARAPVNGDRGNVCSEGTTVAQAMNKRAVATGTLRNQLRRNGQPANVYVAPDPDELTFHSAPSATGAVIGEQAAVEGASAAATNAARVQAKRASEALSCADYGPAMWRRVVNRAIVAAAALEPTSTFEGTYGQSAADASRSKQKVGGSCVSPNVVSAFLDTNKSDTDGAGAVTAQTRRQGLWVEMQRHVAISQDRLWIFLRLMSGTIGGDVTEVITMADAATLKAAKAIQDQRLEISKRVSDMQAKIVETVVASMLKKSEMTMSLENDGVAVVDAEAKKKLHELASGASGRPFFEANVTLKNLTEANGDPPSLQEVLKSLANVGVHMQSTLEQTLAEPGAASASLVELSHPSNSYFVSLRTDAVAAIRTAHETLNAELGSLGGRRRLTLWELVEGGCQVLTNRFANLCGYVLVQARTSTGVSAMYVSHHLIYTNASQARNALAKLVAAATVYIARVSVPAFDAIDSQVERFRVLSAGEKVTDIAVTARSVVAPRPALTAPISGSGWWNEGGRRH
jgi:hypothetical protein